MQLHGVIDLIQELIKVDINRLRGALNRYISVEPHRPEIRCERELPSTGITLSENGWLVSVNISTAAITVSFCPMFVLIVRLLSSTA